MRRTRPSAGRNRKRSSSAPSRSQTRKLVPAMSFGIGEPHQQAVADGRCAAGAVTAGPPSQRQQRQRAFALAALTVEQAHLHRRARVAAGVAAVDLTRDPVSRDGRGCGVACLRAGYGVSPGKRKGDLERVLREKIKECEYDQAGTRQHEGSPTGCVNGHRATGLKGNERASEIPRPIM